MVKQLLKYTIILIFMSGCAASHVTIDVLKPATITLPKDIKTIVIANRSMPDKDSRAKNIIEGALSGEMPLIDRHGSKECIKGLQMALGNDTKFQAVVPCNLDLRGSGTARFPAILDWEQVEQICNRYNADALITLATFDSDHKMLHKKRMVERKQGNSTVKHPVYTATRETRVRAGWRIYYPQSKKVLDENVYSDARSWSADDESAVRAEAKLIPVNEAVNATGYYAGQQYAGHISPTWISVSRAYYRKGNDDMKRATRMARNNDWDEAEQIWQQYTDSPDNKLAGRACHNMALAAEIRGDLHKALDWAKKAYYDHGEKRSANYITVLKRRIDDQAKLQQQLDEH